MRLVYKSKNKQVFKDDKTGIEKVVWTKDPRDNEAKKSGAMLQPIGKDEGEFFDRYRHLKKKWDGTIINKNEERKRKQEKAQEIENFERKEYEKKRFHDPGYKMFH